MASRGTQGSRFFCSVLSLADARSAGLVGCQRWSSRLLKKRVFHHRAEGTPSASLRDSCHASVLRSRCCIVATPRGGYAFGVPPRFWPCGDFRRFGSGSLAPRDSCAKRRVALGESSANCSSPPTARSVPTWSEHSMRYATATDVAKVFAAALESILAATRAQSADATKCDWRRRTCRDSLAPRR